MPALDSCTVSLFRKGSAAIPGKISGEADEVVVAGGSESDVHPVSGAADSGFALPQVLRRRLRQVGYRGEKGKKRE